MESKKVTKKFNSLMWSIIYTLPLLVLFITFIGYLAVYKETGSDALFEGFIFDKALIDSTSVFSGFSWNIIKDTLSDLFVSIGFATNGNLSIFIIIYFTWFIQLAFIHLLVDTLLFIPRFLHQVMERWS